MMTERGDFTAVHEPFSNVAIFGHTEIDGKPLASVPVTALLAIGGFSYLLGLSNYGVGEKLPADDVSPSGRAGVF